MKDQFKITSPISEKMKYLSIRDISKIIHRRIMHVLDRPSSVIAKINGIDIGYYHQCEVVKEILGKSPRMVIDVGANSGEFTKACNYCFNNPKILAFEPIKELHDKLKKIPNVVVYGYGLSNEDSIEIFYQNNDCDAVSSFLKPTSKNFRDLAKKDIKEVKIHQKRFDCVGIDTRLNPVFLKVDTEGNDFKVLQGFGNKLRFIDAVQVEIFFEKYYENQGKLGEISLLLENFGFNRVIQTSIGYKYNKPLSCDFIFLR